MNVWSTKADDPKPKAFFANLLGEEGNDDKLHFDPEQRCLFALFDYREPRMVFLEVLAEIPLEGEDEGSGLDWEFDFNPCCQRIRVDRREWSDVVGSTFVADFPGQLVRADLIAEFFAGKPLPRPTLVLSSP